jgi:phosphomannomutase/phosphoglucomutase
MSQTAPPPEIFKAYDIRGIVERTLTEDTVRRIGQAIGSLALERGCGALAVGRDGRLSGPRLAAALAEGLAAAGVDVIDVGLVATPMLYFATHELGTRSGVMVTGSHNPPEYNGLKMMVAGETLAGDAIQALRQRIVEGRLASGSGRCTRADIRERYLERIVSTLALARPMRVAVDAGNGVAGATAPELYERLGCRVHRLYCEVDGSFPNHHPDPSQPKNLADLIAALAPGGAAADCELGLAFDGDGDRLGVVTKSGAIIYPDRQLMLFAADVLGRSPGAKIIYDVKSTRNLAPWIRAHGGEPVLCKTGHSFIKARIRETGAALAGEMSGHVFFNERWYGFDDGLYAGARLLEILSRSADPSAVLEGLPDSLSTPELNVRTAEGENHALMARLQREARFPGAREVITIDGVRVEYADGFGLARPSNTTPVIVLRFEADDAAALERIQADFRAALHALDPGLQLGF